MKPSSARFGHCLPALRQSPVFASMSDALQHEILALFHSERVYMRGASLNGADEWFYLVVKGRAKVAAHHPETGREHILYLLGPGDPFDVINLLHGKPQDVVVTALDDMEILATPLSRARDWLHQQKNFNHVLLPYLGEQMSRLSNHIEDLALHDTETRLARLILRHMTSPSPVHGLSQIDDLSQEALASMIGSVRVVVAQHFQKWKKEGILSGKRGKWTIANVPALRSIAERHFAPPSEECDFGTS